jgi:hypothetical protein
MARTGAPRALAPPKAAKSISWERSAIKECDYQHILKDLTSGLPLFLILETLGILGGEFDPIWKVWVKRFPKEAREVKKAQSAALAEAYRIVRQGEKGWQAAAWTLERQRDEFKQRMGPAQTRKSALKAAIK